MLRIFEEVEEEECKQLHCYQTLYADSDLIWSVLLEIWWVFSGEDGGMCYNRIKERGQKRREGGREEVLGVC